MWTAAWPFRRELGECVAYDRTSANNIDEVIQRIGNAEAALQYCQSKYDQFEKIVSQLEDMDKELTLLHKTYILSLIHI